MIAIDTNVLVRLLVADDLKQTHVVKKLLEKNQSPQSILVGVIVLVECVWVLRSMYNKSKSDIIRALQGLLDAEVFRLEDESAIIQALQIFKKSSADFPDCLIAIRNKAAGAEITMTFDKDLKNLPGFQVLGSD